MSAPIDLWVCGYCGKRYVVHSLARDCEKRHEADS